MGKHFAFTHPPLLMIQDLTPFDLSCRWGHRPTSKGAPLRPRSAGQAPSARQTPVGRAPVQGGGPSPGEPVLRPVRCCNQARRDGSARYLTVGTRGQCVQRTSSIAAALLRSAWLYGHPLALLLRAI